jgi:HAD superfamily hydrolase (TIGR01484 family)
MKIKLAVFDIDGVLFGEGIPTTEIIAMIGQLKAHGIMTTVATGRPLPIALNIVDKSVFTGPLIVENGGMVATTDGRIIHATRVPLKVKTLVKKLLTVATHQIALVGFVPIFEPDTIYQFTNAPEFVNRLGRTYQWQKVVKTSNVEIFHSWIDRFDFSKIIILTKTAEQRLPIPINITHCDSIFEGTRCYDLTADEVNKGAGVQRLSANLRIPLGNILVIGNDRNDIPTFQLPEIHKIGVNHLGTIPDELRALAHEVILPEELPAKLKALLT